MKNIKYNFLLILLSVLTYSCDLDTTPAASIEEDKAYQNLNSVEYIINGTWSYIWETRNTQACPGWGTIMTVSDFMGSDVVETGKYGYSGVYQYTTMNSGTSTAVVLIWRLAYKMIDNMNNVIAHIDNVPGNDDELRTCIKAQAYALRGYMYLNLATFYADSYVYDPNMKCVPIYTEPTLITSVGSAKKTLSAVYKRAEDDLLEAYKLIGTYTRPAKYKVDKNVIAGMLARVYLQTQQWSDAQKYAEEAHNGYSWMAQDDYLKGFNDLSNAEWIWGQGTTTDQSVASEAFDYKDVYSDASGYYSMMADPYFMELFDQNDIRYQLFEWEKRTKRSMQGYLMYKKFLYKGDKTADIVIMRKAEMVLIEAEALAEQKELSAAIQKINELRITRGADTPDLSGLSKNELIEAILIERRKELWGEGFSLSDIKRRQNPVVRNEVAEEVVPGTTYKKRGHTATKLPDGSSFTPNSVYYNFSIPATEETNNPNLNQ